MGQFCIGFQYTIGNTANLTADDIFFERNNTLKEALIQATGITLTAVLNASFPRTTTEAETRSQLTKENTGSDGGLFNLIKRFHLWGSGTSSRTSTTRQSGSASVSISSSANRDDNNNVELNFHALNSGLSSPRTNPNLNRVGDDEDANADALQQYLRIPPKKVNYGDDNRWNNRFLTAKYMSIVESAAIESLVGGDDNGGMKNAVSKDEIKKEIREHFERNEDRHLQQEEEIRRRRMVVLQKQSKLKKVKKEWETSMRNINDDVNVDRRLVFYTEELPADITRINDTNDLVCGATTIDTTDAFMCTIISSSVCVILEDGDDEDTVRTAVVDGMSEAFTNGDFVANIPDELLPEPV